MKGGPARAARSLVGWKAAAARRAERGGALLAQGKSQAAGEVKRRSSGAELGGRGQDHGGGDKEGRLVRDPPEALAVPTLAVGEPLPGPSQAAMPRHEKKPSAELHQHPWRQDAAPPKPA